MKSLVESILSSTDTGKDAVALGNFHVGEILSAAFVYNCKIPYFYEITDFKGKSTVIVKELDQKSVHDDGYGQNGSCVPVLGKYRNNGEEFRCRVDKRGHLKVRGEYAHEWNGQPVDYYSD